MKTLRTFLLCLIIAIQPLTLQAWSECGHHIISLMAFDLLTKEEQSKFFEVLSKHPRYNDDFIPPKGLPNEQEEQRWKVGRVGYWPDVARSQPKYNRPTWHFELGASLVVGDKSKLTIPSFPGPLPGDAMMETQELYASQAIALCGKTLEDKTSTPIDRALALCWIGHLVADVHQPCHAGSLYMEAVFTESDGDRGANRIITKQGRNMHALWDGLLGREFNLADTRRRIVEITGDQELVQSAASVAVSSNDPSVWLSESREAAIKHVYSSDVLDKLRASVGTKIDDPISLDEAYLKSAGRVAQKRALEAAFRLSVRWRSGLN
jgi:hypothetical protein